MSSERGSTIQPPKPGALSMLDHLNFETIPSKRQLVCILMRKLRLSRRKGLGPVHTGEKDGGYI